jgi:choice-of-anchor A domain-containing protein
MKKTVKFYAVVIALFSFTSFINAGFVDIAAGYNAISFGNMNLQNSDSHGKLAASGNVTLSSYSVGEDASSSDYSVVAGGNVTLKDGTVLNGGVYAGGDVNITGVTVNGNVTAKGNITKNGTTITGSTTANSTVSSPINFTEKKSEAIALSKQLASITATGTAVNNYGSLILSGTNLDVNYFTIDGSLLGNINNLNIDIPTGSVAIINVTGTNITANYLSMSGADATQILFNFSDATSVQLNGTINGSVLAAIATVTINNGNYFGTYITGSLSGSGQLHLATFNEKTTQVPESSVGSNLIVGLCFLGLLVLISKRKQIFQRI